MHYYLRSRVVFLLLTFLSLSTAAASDFPAVPNTEPSDVPPMPPTEAAETLVMPAGFSATVFAAEPDVRNPIAMAWDDQGRMWVAENYTYAERAQRFDLTLRDRVLIFEDGNGDGKADSRQVFLDDVQMLTSVEVGHGGVWLMCPPQLLFVPDADADDKPDGPPIVILDGFEVAEDNYHNFANGLRWGPDGWLYGRCGHSCPGRIGQPGTPDDQRVPLDGGMWRYQPDRKVVEVLCHGTTNPWGHDWDARGELFYINTVNGHLWHVVPGCHFKESFGESMNPLVFERMDTIADHYHYDTSGSWMESRDGKANDLGGGHAHVGMLIYQGERWPEEYQGKLMTINMHGMRVNVERLERTATGYVGRHEPDFLISKDPYFRGTDLRVGPDGNVYVIDWSDTGECHEHTGVHRESGRIYRIGYAGTPQRTFAKPQCLAGDGPLQDLWRNYQQGLTTPSGLRDLASHPDEHVRVWAVRLLVDAWPLDWVTGPNPHAEYPDEPETLALLKRMAAEDPSGLVVRVLASTLQRVAPAKRAEIAEQIVRRSEVAESADLSMLCWYGIAPLLDSAPDELLRIARLTTSAHINRWIARSVSSRYRIHPQLLEGLLTSAGEITPSGQVQTLHGMREGFEGLRRAKRPGGWNHFSELAAVRKLPNELRDLNVLFGDGRALDEVRRVVLDKDADLKARKKALQTLIDSRSDGLRGICEEVSNVRVLNGTALNGLVLFEDRQIAELLVKRYRNFHPDDRARVIETLIARPEWAMVLLEAIERGRSRLDASDLSASQARQILGFRDPALSSKLAAVWGNVRASSQERRAAIEEWKSRLAASTLAQADLARGRVLFNKTCGGCHLLYGQGERVGPDLTGAQRSSLEYLLENILDPSAVVGKDYRMTRVLTTDGRVLSGLVVSNDENRTVLRTATEQVTVPASEIEEVQESMLSAMPDGLLQNLTGEEIRDLLAYLSHPTQVPLR